MRWPGVRLWPPSTSCGWSMVGCQVFPLGMGLSTSETSVLSSSTEGGSSLPRVTPGELSGVHVGEPRP